MQPPTKPPPPRRGEPPERRQSSDSFPALTKADAEDVRRILKGIKQDVERVSLEVETVRENVENVEAQSLKAITTARNAEIAIQELEDSIRVKTAEVNRRIAQVLEEFSNQVTNSTTRQVKTVQRESEQEVRIAELEAALSQRNSAEGRTAGLKGGIVAGGLASTIAYGFLKAIEYLIHSSATPTVPVVLHFLPWWW